MIRSKQVVWITGASSGIGKEMAFQYAKMGYAVALSARRIELLDELEKDIKSNGGDALTVNCDVTDETQIINAINQIVQQYGRIDIAVANAGCAVTGFMHQLSQDDWHRQLNINVVGLAMTAKNVVPELKKTTGRLVLIGSVSAYLPNPFVGAYGA
ncbi:MAG TPA: SDR family NAD(P)-dependent oxidoreductase, partial [Saprospiraceae bacterium]|nr:SDR family NAD(P)-dependent oxidoreductase [Saprospiraceae bacterium]